MTETGLAYFLAGERFYHEQRKPETLGGHHPGGRLFREAPNESELEFKFMGLKSCS